MKKLLLVILFIYLIFTVSLTSSEAKELDKKLNDKEAVQVEKINEYTVLEDVDFKIKNQFTHRHIRIAKD